MKCIYCGNDTAYRIRAANSHKCGSCAHPFAFEPKTDPLKVTDGLFKKVIEGVSNSGKLFYTEKQLWYEFNRRTAKARIPSCGASAILLLLLPAIAHGKHAVAAAVVALLALVPAATTVRKKPAQVRYAPVTLSQFRSDYLKKWMHVHGEPDHLLPDLTPGPAQAPPAIMAEIASFSFDRALVVQHAGIAAMLVANNFHFENNCAVLSLDGYPFDRFASVFSMLRNNPSLKVFALHDASYSGAQMGADLRTSNWFPDAAIRIIDLGIRPNAAIKAGMILIKTTAPTQQPITRSSSLMADELTWLGAGNVAEVENVRPAKLMRAVYQGFARASAATLDDSSVMDDSGMLIWVYDPGVDIYAAE